ncbi:hypothetical protein QYE76_023895 [Lolium multiflorum]|uniref:Uncharacterized protein n=1 Tax=Lolium multiflorum TaxID=4521 RepID=A0AAD8VVI0_LOLMU|nr:hypothetical protein QYE76_023895 [Lolium multiflorum]
MGLCFSRKQPEKAPSPPPVPQQPSAVAGAKPKKPSKIAAAAAPTDEKAKKAPQPKRASNAEESAVAGNGKKAAAPIVVKAKAAAVVEAPVVATVVAKGPAPVRTSSCTKEEVDAILIQCGRLSRSSSGTGMAASSETGGHRRHSGSKRSCDLDRERSGAEEDGDWERHPVSRPSPHRGSPQRKRSGSRERTSGGGSRRSSRSPGRRGEGAPSAGCGGARQQQPGKMVSVPAREKGPAAASSGKRCASPRSSSPARVAAAAGNENAGAGQQKTAAQAPSLSRSSSRKAEHSPLRRSPMAEIDENSLRNNNNISGTNAKPQKKPTEIAVATPTRKTTTERAKEQSSQKEKPSETRAPPSSKTTTGTRTVSVVAESTHPRSGCRSRRASRDFDQNPNLYLLEDIQSYHTSAAAAATPPSFTLPACVSKAQSIVDAVADLNSSSSGSRAYEPSRSADDKGSVNAAVGGDDSLVEPSVHKYVSVRDIRGRGETEMQESAGSNTLSGNVWTPSCESTDRTWSTSRSSNHGDEVVEQPRQSKQRPAAAQPEPSVRSRAGSSGANNAHRGRSAHRGSGSGAVASGRSGARGVVSASS